MTRYMVIERFVGGNVDAVYARFHRSGRMLPAGLDYIDSWLSRDRTRCFQLMATDDFGLFAAWTAKWADLVEFEIIEIGDKPAAASDANR